jgi:hypothetical protein
MTTPFESPFFIATIKANERVLSEHGLTGPLNLNYLVTIDLYNRVWRHYRRGDDVKAIIELMLNELKILNDDQRQAYSIAFGLSRAEVARARKAEHSRKLQEFDHAHPEVPIEIYEQDM